MKAATERQDRIILYLQTKKSAVHTDEIVKALSKLRRVSAVTVKRDLSHLVSEGTVIRTGKARATQYELNKNYLITSSVDVDQYFEQDIDERPSFDRFQFDLFERIENVSVFSKNDEIMLMKLNAEYEKQKSQLSPTLLKREFERLTIELSWKSSAIEGNTYSLLETETLLKEGVPAPGKTAEDTTMLLNHKESLEFIRKNRKEFKKISIRKIEELHRLLIKNLGVSPNLRKKMVSITGTKYRPIDNIFQIKESLEKTCVFISNKKNPFERAFWAILLISYIQPFEDGNKRTSRMLSTALLLADDAIPLSYRSVKVVDYKKAILLFYERNNISAFKKIFLEQVHFAVKNYFRSTP